MDHQALSIIELGALGEFFGSIAVFGTLIYLAIQIRQSTRASRSATIQSINDGMREALVSWSEPHFIPVFTKAARDGWSSLDQEELLLLNLRISALLRMYASAWAQWKDGQITDNVWDGFETALRAGFTSGVPRMCWDAGTIKTRFASNFVQYLEDLLTASD